MRYRPLALGFLALSAHAIETDNFSNRDVALRDAGAVLDAKMNEWMRDAVNFANEKSPDRCNEAAFRKRFNKLSIKRGQYGTMKSRLEDWADAEAKDRDSTIATIPLKFTGSIYGAVRNYQSLWKAPSNRYVIRMAKSIRLHGHLVGLDKFSHFLAQGLETFEHAEQNGDLEKALAKNIHDEEGIFGYGVTGIKSYADAAATYSGYAFHKRLVGSSDSHVVCAASGRLQLNPDRPFSFKDYASDAWDEGINCADMRPRVRTDFEFALKLGAPGSRPADLKCPVEPAACRALATLPMARFYVNPKCLAVPDSANSTGSLGEDYSPRVH